MLSGSAAVWVEVGTVHCTRIVAPPPLPELLHCVMVAPDVLSTGLQATVGAVPPPAPEPLHWLTVAGAIVGEPVMLLVICTRQVTVPPPPLPEPLHCVTEFTRSADVVVDSVHVGGALAAPWHSRTVTVELDTPVAVSRLLDTVTTHSTAWPPALSVPLHWLIATGAALAEGNSAACQPKTAISATRRAAETGCRLAETRRAFGRAEPYP